MDNDVQSRKWLLTFNNPKEHGYYSRERLLELLNLLTFRYCCLCDERAESGTYHTHVYLYSTSPIKFIRLKNLFPGAHIDKARGTSKENMEYVSKTGKWAKDKKAGTNLADTFLEIGTLPKERIPQAETKEKLYEMIESGMSASEIIEADKEYIYKLKNIEELGNVL